VAIQLLAPQILFQGRQGDAAEGAVPDRRNGAIAAERAQDCKGEGIGKTIDSGGVAPNPPPWSSHRFARWRSNSPSSA